MVDIERVLRNLLHAHCQNCSGNCTPVSNLVDNQNLTEATDAILALLKSDECREGIIAILSNLGYTKKELDRNRRIAQIKADAIINFLTGEKERKV